MTEVKDVTDAKAPVDKAIIDRAAQVEVLDKHGAKHRLADLIAGKRTCLVFIRHFCKSRLVSDDGVFVGIHALRCYKGV